MKLVRRTSAWLASDITTLIDRLAAERLAEGVNMQQQIKNPAGGRGFKVGAEVIQNPQQNHEAFSLDCQEKFDTAHLLADMLDKHLALRAEVALLRAENARLMRLIAGGCA